MIRLLVLIFFLASGLCSAQEIGKEFTCGDLTFVVSGFSNSANPIPGIQTVSGVTVSVKSSDPETASFRITAVYQNGSGWHSATTEVPRAQVGFTWAFLILGQVDPTSVGIEEIKKSTQVQFANKP